MREQGAHGRKLREASMPRTQKQGVAVMKAGEVLGHSTILECMDHVRDFKLYPKNYASDLRL